jgi:hypothetical protein
MKKPPKPLSMWKRRLLFVVSKPEVGAKNFNIGNHVDTSNKA